MLWFRISCTGDSGRSFSGLRRNRRFSQPRFRVGGLEMPETNFLGSLEIPSSEKGSSWWFGCSVFALVRESLIVASSSKAASLPWPVMVEIGGMSLSSSLNLGTLVHQGAGSSETEVFHPVTLVRVHGSGKSSSNFGPLGKYGETVLRNPSTLCR